MWRLRNAAKTTATRSEVVSSVGTKHHRDHLGSSCPEAENDTKGEMVLKRISTDNRGRHEWSLEGVGFP